MKYTFIRLIILNKFKNINLMSCDSSPLSQILKKPKININEILSDYPVNNEVNLNNKGYV